ncbi:hypothetical protein FGO68_gene10085 [Halteria grandinella]|uniref:Uncharacterized protein n=1 Tax=Halteria grandinella TaxID=5974 RepID=A0A8J8NBG6_HALGN|nr:hypothetical protein FGO68_gene10085 [Halteria grandinella]
MTKFSSVKLGLSLVMQMQSTFYDAGTMIGFSHIYQQYLLYDSTIQMELLQILCHLSISLDLYSLKEICRFQQQSLSELQTEYIQTLFVIYH